MNTELDKKTLTPDLSQYETRGYTVGAGLWRRLLWYIFNVLVFMNPLIPFYGLKRTLLRLFGASIGAGVIIKPRVNIKYPWRLAIGNNSWIGEGVWIDNLSNVIIGNNACISQDVLLLTGNHNYKDPSFSLITKPINICDGAWVGARSVICPGVTLGKNAVATVGSVVSKDSDENGIYSGNPAQKVRIRTITAPTDSKL